MERVIESAVCPFCACLCDDLVITVVNNEIKEIRNACRLGVAKFRACTCTYTHARTQASQRLKCPRVGGRSSSYDDAIAEATEILRRADKPLIYGLCNSSYEAQRVALAIAMRKRGVLDISESICHNILYTGSGLKKYPFYYALLDEIREKANVIVYWGSNPVVSHPRHLSRYSVYPTGRYAMRGVTDREVIAIDVMESELKKHWLLQVKPGDDARIAEILTRLVSVSGDCAAQDIDEDTDIERLKEIAERLKRALYGVIFIGLGVLGVGSEDARHNVDAILALVDALNKGEGRKYVLFPMKGHYNVMGAVQLLMRETGYPFGLDFSRSSTTGTGTGTGSSIFEPGKTTVMDVIEEGEVDAALIVGADPATSFPGDKVKRLAEIPLIVLDPFETPTTSLASIAIPTAITGIEAEGIAYRMDGLPLKLNKIVESEYPSDREVLERIYRALF